MKKKYINIINAAELMAKLMDGKCVEGRLYFDKETRSLVFKAYNRKSSKYVKDRMVKKLPWGWVKESIERIRVFGSFPKDEGTASVMRLLDDNTRDAKNALIERELDLMEFC